MKRSMFWAAALLSLAQPAMAQIADVTTLPGPQAGAAIQTSTGRSAKAPANATFCSTDAGVTWSPCPPSSGGGGAAVPTGTAGAPNSSVVTVQGISGGTPQNINNSQINGNTIATGTGASNTGTQRMVLSSDSPLATGAATSANQTTQTTALQALSATVGTRGSAAPATAQTTQGVDAAGNGRALLTGTTGVLAAPTAGTAQSTGTVTALAATTSTTICPATTNPVVYEVQIYGTAPVLLGLDGQTLTGITPAAGSGAYMLLPTQYTLYVGPVARTNIITAYTATAQTVTCNIVTRQ